MWRSWSSSCDPTWNRLAVSRAPTMQPASGAARERETASPALHVGLQQAVQQTLDRARQVILFLIQRNAQGQRQRVAQCRADQLPRPDARVEVAPKYPGLLARGNDLCQQQLTIEV